LINYTKKNLNFLFHCIFIILIIVFFFLSFQDDKIFDQIIEKSINKGMTDEKKLTTLLNVTHNFLKDKKGFYQISSKGKINPNNLILKSINGDGDCGVYSKILSRLLIRAGIKVRLGQMKCDNIWACHIIVEAKINNKWIIADPTYNVIFKNRNNQMTEFNEIKNNFEYFRSQVPSNYNLEYDYDDMRYTNWEKMPIITVSAAKIISFLKPNTKYHDISLKIYLLNIYKVYLVGLIIIYCLLIFLQALRYFK
jgi:hypothetical protein